MAFMLINRRRQATFAPQKNADQGTEKRRELVKFAHATLGSGNLRQAIQLPEGEDQNEWLAANTVDFFNQVSMLYTTVEPYCRPETCPHMTAGAAYVYKWADETVKTPIDLPACDYIERLIGWVQAQIDDQEIFPSKMEVPFPKNFQAIIKTIFRRLFRIYAHMYHSHFDRIRALNEEAHINTCFKHFILFAIHYGLIPKEEMAPLAELIESYK